MQAECLLRCGAERATLQVSVGFLHLQWREIGRVAAPFAGISVEGEPRIEIVRELSLAGSQYSTGRESVERRVRVQPLPIESGNFKRLGFSFPATRSVTPLGGDPSGQGVAVKVRRQNALEGLVEIGLQRVDEPLFKATVRVHNLSPVTAEELEIPDAVLMRTFASTHTVLHARNAEFISHLNPPAEYQSLAVSCKNIGVSPVLIGDPGSTDRETMLAVPTSLGDFPRVAADKSGQPWWDETNIFVRAQT